MARKLQDCLKFPRTYLMLGAALLVLYWPCITIPPAGDDWMLISPVQELVREREIAGALSGIFETPTDRFYRPLTLIPFAFVEQDFSVFQSLKLLLMLVFGWLLYRTARGIGLSVGWSTFVAAVVTLHQVFAVVITELDYLGDFLASFVFLLLIDLYRRFAQEQVSHRALYLYTILLSSVCLLSKEAGVACFTIPLLFAIIQPDHLSVRKRKQLLISATSILLITFSYMVVRSALSIPTTAENGRYSLHFGLNIFKNCALAAAALLSPVNTIYVALESSLWKLLAGLFVLLFLSLFVIGFVIAAKSRHWRWPVLLLFVLGLAQGPVFLMPHLTEGNFSRSLAPGWLAITICFSVLFEKYRARSIRNSFAILMVCWFAFDVSAVYDKCREIVSDQQRFARFRTELKTNFEGAEADSLVIAVIDPGTKGYSVYRQPFMLDLALGEIQLGLPTAFYPRSMHFCALVVSDTNDARLKDADCLAHEDGRMEEPAR